MKPLQTRLDAGSWSGTAIIQEAFGHDSVPAVGVAPHNGRGGRYCREFS